MQAIVRVLLTATVCACLSALCAAGVLTDPSQFQGATTLVDFETYPNGAPMQYVTSDLDDEWSGLGVLLQDDSMADGVSAYSQTYAVKPHSGAFAIGDSQNTAGGWLRFVFAQPVAEAGVWVQNGDQASTVEFYDSAGTLLAAVQSGAGDVFTGFASLNGIRSLRVVDPDYYMVDDLEFGSCGPAVPHGAGCAGSGGFTPTFAVTGCASAGAQIVLELGSALGGAPAFLAVGAAPASLPVGGGCHLNVFPVVALLGPIPLGGVGPGTGSLTFGAGLPQNLPQGGSFGLQFLIVDPGAPAGFVATNGVILTVN